ncbi:MAG: hypothetical protein MZV64_52695 [Ignavibacteriales bacterium]|nr:hypothetical protein [Ignavibacteriales bacterium]
MKKIVYARDEARAAKAEAEVRLDITAKGDTVEAYVDGPFRETEAERQGRGASTCTAIPATWSTTASPLRSRPGPNLVLTTVIDGDIDVRGVEGVFDVRNVTNAGPSRRRRRLRRGPVGRRAGVTVAFRRHPDGPCSFKSVSGDVEVDFPGQASADFRFKTMTGEIYSDFEVTRLPKAAPVRSDRPDQDGGYLYRSDGFNGVRAGKGGPEIKLETLSGDILIAKISEINVLNGRGGEHEQENREHHGPGPARGRDVRLGHRPGRQGTGPRAGRRPALEPGQAGQGRGHGHAGQHHGQGLRRQGDRRRGPGPGKGPRRREHGFLLLGPVRSPRATRGSGPRRQAGPGGRAQAHGRCGDGGPSAHGGRARRGGSPAGRAGEAGQEDRTRLRPGRRLLRPSDAGREESPGREAEEDRRDDKAVRIVLGPRGRGGGERRHDQHPVLESGDRPRHPGAPRDLPRGPLVHGRRRRRRRRQRRDRHQQHQRPGDPAQRLRQHARPHGQRRHHRRPVPGRGRQAAVLQHHERRHRRHPAARRQGQPQDEVRAGRDLQRLRHQHDPPAGQGRSGREDRAGQVRIAFDKSLYGVVNGGGQEIGFNTFSGDIYIRKRKSTPGSIAKDRGRPDGRPLFLFQ